jgi:type III secretion system FlhB-like substrate exporter
MPIYNSQSAKETSTSLVPANGSRSQSNSSKENKKPVIDNVFSPTVTGSYTPEQIIAIARLHGIPIRSDPSMTKILSKADSSSDIPPELHRLAAEFLLWAKRIEGSEKKDKNLKKHLP